MRINLLPHNEFLFIKKVYVSETIFELSIFVYKLEISAFFDFFHFKKSKNWG